MEIISIIFFLFVSWAFGNYFVRSEDLIERLIMSLGLGMAIFSILAAFLSVLHIPINWWLFLFLAIPSLKFIKFPKYEFNWKVLVLLVIFCFSLYIYMSGSFSYSLFEDGDPWRHAAITNYIASEKTALEPIEGVDRLQYVDSYPPAYDTLMAVLYQLSDNLVWTLKFFNALMISLSTLFFFYFMKRFTNNENAALFSTFVLAMLPPFLTHFIWAHSMIGAILPVFLYFLVQRINVAATLSYAAILVIQPTQAAKITILLGVFIIVKSIINKKVDYASLFTGIFGGIISFIVWWGPMFFKYGGIMSALKAGGTTLGGGSTLKIVGSADRVYTFNDFFFTSAQNGINNAIGIGWVAMLFFFLTIILVIWKWKELESWVIISLAWLMTAFLGVKGASLPVQLFAFRFWLLFAFFFAVFIAYGYVSLYKLKGKIPSFLLTLFLVIIIVGIFFTSGEAKKDLNTMDWEQTAGEFTRYGNLDSWKHLSTLNSPKVFYPCRADRSNDINVMAVGAKTCVDCVDELNFKLSFVNRTGEEVADFAASKGYEYLFIDGICLEDFRNSGLNDTEQVYAMNSLLQNISYPLVHRSDGGFLWMI